MRLTLDLTQIACPACGSNERWDDMKAVERQEGDPLSILPIELFCDCGTFTLVYLDFAGGADDGSQA